MFYRSYSVLTTHLHPDDVPIPRVAEHLASQTETQAIQAMNQGFDTMLLSERRAHPENYTRIQQARRRALEALLGVVPTQAIAERAVDLIGMIVEESAWAAQINAPLEDEGHPEIDLQCAETAALFGWTFRILGTQFNSISPQIGARMLAEVRRRVFKPLLAHEDYVFMRSEGRCPMALISSIAIACLLLETDDSRRTAILRRSLRLLDDACVRHGQKTIPLYDAITDISAVADFVALLRSSTRGMLDLTHNIPSSEWLDEILFSWIDENYFNDPAGDGMKPILCGSDIFRIGAVAGDDALTILGAQVYHNRAIPSATLTGRLMDLTALAQLEPTAGKPPHLRYATTQNNALMVARIPGLYCAMHTGGGRYNAGDFCLFSDGIPILIDGGQSHMARNLPELAGFDQLRTPSLPCHADFEDQSDRELMSIDLTNAYPPRCGLQAYQRSVLTLREERTVRIMDAISFIRPSEVSFSFVTPLRPAVLSNAIRLGAVRLTWEGDFDTFISPLDNGLTRIVLNASTPIQQSIFSFNFERA